ncbi:hypothetical protein [Acinetobacter entericus]|uniref:hypothetical protein n=1 Tax=Acinetobacter entericus TaxID=2989714 RepID=UPI00223F8EAF|nr:hypothetical protein [Acinetobacter entericus]
MLKDSLATASGFFGGITTLIAAYIAANLFNDWRDEKNYELENTLLSNILMDLKPLYIELLKARSDSINLKNIETSFIVKTDYLERNRIDLVISTLNLFPNIKIYSHLKNDYTLIDLYNKFDKHCYCFSHFFRILFLEKYRIYYEVIIEENQKITGKPPLKYYDIFRPYTDSRQDSLKIEIQEVLSVFKKDALTAEINGVRKLTTYEDWLQETINLHDQIHDYCIKGLKVPN